MSAQPFHRAQPFHFGVSSPKCRTRDEWRAFAQRAEAAGFDIAYLADHTTYVDPLLPLVTMAEATTRLRVGTLVLNIGFWHPLLLARSAATLQLLTEGRLELGLGGGWAKKEHDELGIEFWSAVERVQRLAESMAIVRAALHGHEITATAHYPVAAAAAPPGPLDDPPTLLVGGFGERLLRSCAPFADVIQLTGLIDDRAGGLQIAASDADAFATRVGWIREAAGERFAQMELSLLMQAVRVTRSDEETARVTQEVAASFELEPDAIASTPLVLVGTIDQIVDKLHALRADLGITHVCVFAAAMDEFAPVIERMRTDHAPVTPPR